MKKVFPLLALILSVYTLSAQYDPRENFFDAEFFFAEEDYEEALYSFNQVYKDGYEENANINYRIGQCLLKIDGRKTEAIPYLETAVKNISDRYREGSFKEEQAPPDAYLYLANAYRINYQFDEAIENYNKFLEFADEESRLALFTRTQIEACNRAREAMKEPVEYRAGVLGQINQLSVPIYNLTVSGDMNTVAFMGKHKFYNGVYVARKEEGKWLRPLNITPSIQSDGNQDVLSLSHDGNEILIAWNDEFESEIWSTVWANGRWNRSQPIGDPVNSRFFESHASFTPDSKSIYFTSNRRESMGEMDIFRCDRLEDGSWSEVVLLGENINTPLNEEKPFVSPDGKKLFFSSQGHEGIGGYDIFYVDINEDGTYGKPVSLGYPLNTTDDDFAFSPNEISYEGYLTAYDNGAHEEVELLRLELIPEGAQPVAVAFLPEEEEEEPVAEVITETAEEAAEEVVEEAEEIAEEVEEAVEEVEEVVEEVAEEAVTETETYIIRPVFFDFDSDALNENARKKLDDLILILNKFPDAALTINGHTDAVGSMEYNKALSARRAASVSRYLRDNGINEDRITVNPFGETRHIARNRTADDHDAPKGRALNRRVEFKVKTTSDAIVVEKIEVPDHLKIR